ncbi:MAG: hypothetical protein AAF065_11895 [Verrucomicrobiota bacterium]
MSTDKPRYWLTPPDLYERLASEFHFDFDPCPCPRPEGYNSLEEEWGQSNYVNPPFLKVDAPHGGPSAFVRKAVEEQSKGKRSVFILPVPWNLGLLLQAGAELRWGGHVHWLDVDTKQPCKRRHPQVICVLNPST